MSNFVAVVITVSLFVKQRFELLHAVFACRVKPEQIAHHRCLAFVNDKAFFILSISEDTAVAKHHIGLDCLLMPEFDTRGELAKLILRDGGHNCKPKLCIFIKRIDVIVLEKYAHSPSE